MDEAHLASLLAEATKLADHTSLRERRLAAHQLLDYYELIFREAREATGSQVHPDSFASLVNAVLVEIPLKQVDHLKGLGKFRNALYHDALYNPPAKVLSLYLKAVEKLREELKQGAAQIAEKLQGLDSVARALLEHATLLKSDLPSYTGTTKEKWTKIADDALALAENPAPAVIDQQVALLVKIASHRAAVAAEEAILSPSYDDPEDYEPAPDDPSYYEDYEPAPEYEPQDEGAVPDDHGPDGSEPS